MTTENTDTMAVFSDYFTALLEGHLPVADNLMQPVDHLFYVEGDDYDQLVHDIAEQNIKSNRQLNKPVKVTTDLDQTLPPRTGNEASQHIHYLLLKINKVRLAMPAAKILSLEAIIRQRFGKSDLQAGKQVQIKYQSSPYKVIDLANCSHLTSQQLGRYTFAAIIRDSNIALACNDLVGVVKVARSDMKYTQFNQRVPWIKGRIPEYQALLLDLDAFCKTFTDE